MKNNYVKISDKFRNFASKTFGKTFDFFNYILSRIFNEPLVHVIGDSHTTVFKNKRNFIVHHLGPATMFNLNKINSTTKSNEKLMDIVAKINPKKDTVMLVFGEIDCRLHIYYQYKKQKENVTISELIGKTILNYGVVLEKINEMGIKLFVYGIPATGRQENYYNYPFYGSLQTRSQISREFNEKLKAFCKEKNYSFIDIYEKIKDSNGLASKEFLFDEVHLNIKIVPFVRQKLLSSLQK